MTVKYNIKTGSNIKGIYTVSNIVLSPPLHLRKLIRANTWANLTYILAPASFYLQHNHPDLTCSKVKGKIFQACQNIGCMFWKLNSSFLLLSLFIHSLIFITFSTVVATKINSHVTGKTHTAGRYWSHGPTVQLCRLSKPSSHKRSLPSPWCYVVSKLLVLQLRPAARRLLLPPSGSKLTVPRKAWYKYCSISSVNDFM